MFHLSPFQISSFFIVTVLFALSYKYLTDSIHLKPEPLMTTAKSIKTAMTTLSHAKIVPRRSGARGHADHGWLNSYHTFSFASYYDPEFQSFGALRVLNEDRVAPGTGFPTHPHRDAEIFSYILSGELTHRDSMIRKGSEGTNKDSFYRMKRGDVQFTTGGKGIAHSEENEHSKDWVHFLQIWALPWKKSLPPTYHTSTFNEADKRKGFVPIISPLKGGPNATAAEEKAAVPVTAGTIPIHADLLFSAGIIPPGKAFEYKIGGADAVQSQTDRKTYIHVPMTKGGKARIRLDGRDGSVLQEGDGAFVSSVNAGDVLSVESIGEEDAEVLVLDSN
jgi:quercetin 2,3-dioxygenase